MNAFPNWRHTPPGPSTRMWSKHWAVDVPPPQWDRLTWKPSDAHGRSSTASAGCQSGRATLRVPDVCDGATLQQCDRALITLAIVGDRWLRATTFQSYPGAGGRGETVPRSSRDLHHRLCWSATRALDHDRSGTARERGAVKRMHLQTGAACPSRCAPKVWTTCCVATSTSSITLRRGTGDAFDWDVVPQRSAPSRTAAWSRIGPGFYDVGVASSSRRRWWPKRSPPS